MQVFVQLCRELDQRNDLGYELEGKDFLKQHFVAKIFKTHISLIWLTV